MSTNPYAIRVEYLDVNGNKVATDQEGYIQNMDEWSEAFAVALAEKEGLVLTKDHWEVIYYIKAYYEEHRVQAQVRDMIKHFKNIWGPERGNNRYLHDIFPKGGPQKQGNRLAGIRRTKGEH
ncbi:MAG: TusE/DsrC/DsvC family sulfur relay protein [Candidatus Thiodiazotropha sp.]|nr:TusE/DsrC/DsvC family sulfur relay protein [Candidatus Thiodiazotropha sp.]MCM8884352.1 TusE/DsrC/DsvC family sulfur relay protein [Candidatus Thiodiazotropha sp.]MCM8920675.1 TusE/DsrC/DsvC family sulfur relay protein [Candidatus Thiodiazotropha sp.]